MRGVRIQNVVNELGGEKIDVIEWNDEPERLVANALSPAQVTEVLINEDENTATVVVPERQLSLAIGKEGQNARLAAKLTGWRIDIKSEATIAAERAAAAEAAANAPAENGAVTTLDDDLAESEIAIGDADLPVGAEPVAESSATLDGVPETEDDSAESELQRRETAVGAES
jgi:transcription antitermination factor NusA-like protein